jgi:hypothetical protein
VLEVSAMPVPMLVDLVNGWGTVPRAQGGGREPAPISGLVDDHAVPDALAALLTDAALERVADALHPVFATTAPDERARLVTALLATSRVRPALGSAGERVRPTWLVGRDDDAVLAAAAVALRAQLAEHDPARLGTCVAGGCADVFVDASPGAHRRFCSVTCQNRERVAAFRRRRSSGARRS